MNLEQNDATTIALAQSVEDMASIVEELDLKDEATQLRSKASQIRDDRFRVVVLGEFKRGKSTLLNAMLNDTVLPVKVTECTAIITIIRYGQKPEVSVVHTDGGNETMSPLEFSERFCLKIDDVDDRDGAFDRFSTIDHAVLSYPLELCRNRIELVDSPGLGANPKRTKRAREFLPQADAVVFVLCATQFLKEDESHFLDSVLFPLGLRNVFFVINKWNLIDEAVLRPEDADRERADLEQHIQRRLSPMCFVDGVDCSAQRIFRVNALGALKARLRKPPSAAMLEESGVPDLEESLQQFLLKDRVRARFDVLNGSIQATVDNVKHAIGSRTALAQKSIAEVEAEILAVKPKLERLRGIRKHIANFLDGQSLNLQDRLVLSFQNELDKLDKDLPEEIEKFNLPQIMSGSMVWNAVTDWTKKEDDKYAKKVEKFLKPKIQSLMERRLTVWQQSVIRNEMKAVEIDVDKHLQEEAAEYRRVLQSIEEEIGSNNQPAEAREIVHGWLRPEKASDNPLMDYSAFSALGELSWVIGAISLDFASDLLFHLSSVWIPFIGWVIAAARLGWREKTMREEFRRKIEENLRSGLKTMGLKESAKIRETVKKCFGDLKNKVVGRIDAEIAMIDANLQGILERKKDREFSAEAEAAKLKDAQTRMNATVEQIQQVTRV